MFREIADINIRSMMCVPLLSSDGQVLSILTIDSQNTLGQFTHEDLDILMTVTTSTCATLTSRVRRGPPEAHQMGKLLLEDVRRHAQGYPQSDDITIMAFGRNPDPLVQPLA